MFDRPKDWFHYLLWSSLYMIKYKFVNLFRDYGTESLSQNFPQFWRVLKKVSVKCVFFL